MTELFHALDQPDSAAARLEVVELGVKEQVDFRNVIYDDVLADLRARGGTVDRLPALWDGESLHQGLPAVREALARLRR